MLKRVTRRSTDLIDWKDFLRFFEEGEPVGLPAPRNLYKEDMLISKTNGVAFFTTGAKEIKFKGPYQAKDKDENGLMAVRWRYFNFTHKILEKDQKNSESCRTCFANFL